MHTVGARAATVIRPSEERRAARTKGDAPRAGAATPAPVEVIARLVFAAFHFTSAVVAKRAIMQPASRTAAACTEILKRIATDANTAIYTVRAESTKVVLGACPPLR